jgi:hypothetical protein
MKIEEVKRRGVVAKPSKLAKVIDKIFKIGIEKRFDIETLKKEKLVSERIKPDKYSWTRCDYCGSNKGVERILERIYENNRIREKDTEIMHCKYCNTYGTMDKGFTTYYYEEMKLKKFRKEDIIKAKIILEEALGEKLGSDC